MRSVIVFLRGTAEAEVAAYLDGKYPSRREPWVCLAGVDPCLSIDLYRDGPHEYEPEAWGDIVRRFGGGAAVGVIADVSGRCPGDDQVASFVAGLLNQFDGAAMDEYTPHLWSLAELQDGRQVAGHPFFDYKGWFADGG